MQFKLLQPICQPSLFVWILIIIIERDQRKIGANILEMPKENIQIICLWLTNRK